MTKKQRTDIEQRKYYVIHNQKTVKRLNKKTIQRIKSKEIRFINADDEDVSTKANLFIGRFRKRKG